MSASVFSPALAISVTCPQALEVGGSAVLHGPLWLGLVSGMVWERVCGQARGLVGRLRGPARGLEGLTLYSGVFALLGSQMVVVNSSSPTAACSGPRETRGIEESVTPPDGNAESL